MSFVSSYLSCPIEWDYVIQSKKLYLIPLVSSWLHPISFLPIISHLPSSSLVIQTASSFSYRCPLWITTPGLFFMETYWLCWWSHATAKIFPPFLFKWQSLWGGPECGSMCKSQQSLPSCTCVKQCVVGRLHCSRKPSLSFFFFFFSLPRLQDALWKSIITLWLVAGTSASRLWLKNCWHPERLTRWQVPRAVSFETKQTWHAFYNEKRNLSKWHNFLSASH